LAIAPEVIKRQAKEHGLLFREELGYMVLHGFLHLLGYDHETSERDARVMFKLQDQLFEEILAAQKVKR
jgi:probable rRNA maturation factor